MTFEKVKTLLVENEKSRVVNADVEPAVKEQKQEELSSDNSVDLIKQELERQED